MKSKTTVLFNWFAPWVFLMLAALAEYPDSKLRYIMYLTGYALPTPSQL
jgi:hypothetical protein